jgi:hypothetical protein
LLRDEEDKLRDGEDEEDEEELPARNPARLMPHLRGAGSITTPPEL